MPCVADTLSVTIRIISAVPQQTNGDTKRLSHLSHVCLIYPTSVSSIPRLSHLSRSLADRWGTTVDLTTSFLHSSRFSAFTERQVISKTDLTLLRQGRSSSVRSVSDSSRTSGQLTPGPAVASPLELNPSLQLCNKQATLTARTHSALACRAQVIQSPCT